MIAKILGVTHYEKDGKKNFTLHFVQEFSESDRSNGAEGLKVSTVWTRLEKAASIAPNDLVDLQFEPGFDSKATLTDILRYDRGFQHPLNALSVKAVYDYQPASSETATTAKGGK